MGDDKIGVVHKNIDRGGCHKDSRKATDDKHQHKGKRVEHGGGEANRSTPKRSKPIKGFDGRGNCDDHGRHTKGGGQNQIHSRDEHVMAPNDKTEKSDRDHGEDHCLVSEDRFAAKNAQNIAHHAHRRENHDVDLRMAKEPEEMLPEKWLPSLSGIKEVCARIEI